MTSSRFALALGALAFGSLLLAGCGEGKGASGSAVEKPQSTTPVTDEGRAKLEAAGRNVKEIYGVLSWIDDSVEAQGKEEKTSLEALARQGLTRLDEACNEIIRSVGESQDAEKMERVESWMGGTVTAERARPDVDERGIAAVLDKNLVVLRTFMLPYRPNDEKLRNALGYTKITTDFDALAEAPYLDTNEIKKIERLARDVRNQAEVVDGTIWLKDTGAMQKQLEELLLDIEKREAAHVERMKDPWEQKAKAIHEEITGKLAKDLNASYEWVFRTHKPYVLIIEKDAGWNETQVAEKRADALLQLHKIFYETYGKTVELRPIEDPIPVVYFNKARAYNDYAATHGMRGALGHFEPSTGRLFTSKDTDIGTVFHEGTHQLSFYNGASGSFLQTSYWFEEGLAEFLAGNTLVKKEGEDGFEYEIGLLQKGRLDYWRQNEGKAYSLWDLLALTYASREINTMNGDEDKNLMVYSQGWFVCYFMNHYAVDEKGMYVYDAPGKYRDAWLKFFASSMKGKSDRATFLSCLGMEGATEDDPRFKAFEKEMLGFYEWINRKVAMKQEKDNKLIPWDQCFNRGKLVGEDIDDLVIDPKR